MPAANSIADTQAPRADAEDDATPVESVNAERSTPGENGFSGVDEMAESAFRAEARARGETVKVPDLSSAAATEESASLPPLEKLVERIPADVRETLDELFRAKFVAVRRVSAKALKS